VFLRAQEQEVLVYPSPISTTFIQSRNEEKAHSMVTSGEQGMIEPGSLAVHLEHISPDEFVSYQQGQAKDEEMKVPLSIDYNGDIGIYSLTGRVYANDASNKRPLMFTINPQTYSVVEEVDLAESRRLQEEALAEQRRIAAEKALIEKREADRTRNLIIIGVGNVVAIILGLLIWFVMRKLKAKKQMVPEMQLQAPKK